MELFFLISSQTSTHSYHYLQYLKGSNLKVYLRCTTSVILDNLYFFIAKIYAYLYFNIKKYTGLRIRGLGFLLRRIRKPRIIKFKNKKLYLNPKVISSYGLSIINKNQEKETEYLLDKIMGGLVKFNKKVNFIEIGSNVGIFLLQMSGYKIINYIIGFEPSIGCVEAATKTLEINNFHNFKIYNNLVGSKNTKTLYSNDIDPQKASIYKSKDNKNSKLMEEILLDENKSIKELLEEDITIVLIDVEGYEPNVMKGGMEMINKKKPLIIFEYNSLSKKYYSIHEIYNLLGEDWEIFRLRRDMLLDKEVEKSWNCVAINKKSIFPELLKKLDLIYFCN